MTGLKAHTSLKNYQAFVDKLSEALLMFRGHHTDQSFDNIVLEAADLFSCFMGIFNSIGDDYEKILVRQFSRGCHVCGRIPCACEYNFVINFKS